MKVRNVRHTSAGFPGIWLLALLLAGAQPVAASEESSAELRTSGISTQVQQGEKRPASEFAVPLPDEPSLPVITGEAVAVVPDAPDGSISLPVPEVAAPPVTDEGKGLEPQLAIQLPPPPEPVVIIVPPEPVIALVEPPDPLPLRIDPPDAVLLKADAVERQLVRLAGTGQLRRSEVAEILAFYRDRGFRPAWTHALGWNGRADRLRLALASAGADGLDPARYRTVSVFHGTVESLEPPLAAAEVDLTVAAVRYGRELRIGQIEPRRIHPLITPKLIGPDTLALLSDLSTAADPGSVLAMQAPPHAGYQALRRRLAELHLEAYEAVSVPVPPGPVLRIGMRDPRVPLIRLAAGLGFSPDDLYSQELSRHVAGLQRLAGVAPDGRFTDRTGRLLSGGTRSQEVGEVIANMELWRFVPRELGNSHIFVNAPSYRMDLVSNGAVTFTSRTIVGKDETQTPFFSDEMDHIVVNPSWYVPPGILKRDKRYLDPAWTAARGYELRLKGNIVTVRVPPGTSNALGAVKFMFPNEHAVYLHDTNARGLFNATNRALSNGCVRVENPFRLAAHLFADEGWTEERFQRIVGHGERPMRLKEKLPVHLVYLTLTTGADGTLERHPDIYGHVARLRLMLDGG